jgi:hypothetical protein
MAEAGVDVFDCWAELDITSPRNTAANTTTAREGELNSLGMEPPQRF